MSAKALISCWQAEERAVPPSPPQQEHPGSKDGLKFNDASCQLRQAASANELAPAADWAAAAAAAAAPGNVAHVSEGWGSTGADGERECVVGGVGGFRTAPRGPRLFEEWPNFHISLRTAD